MGPSGMNFPYWLRIRRLVGLTLHVDRTFVEARQLASGQRTGVFLHRLHRIIQRHELDVDAMGP